MSGEFPPIAVVGATGHTGRFVVAELGQRGAQMACWRPGSCSTPAPSSRPWRRSR